jgi:hypothetical protein
MRRWLPFWGLCCRVRFERDGPLQAFASVDIERLPNELGHADREVPGGVGKASEDISTHTWLKLKDMDVQNMQALETMKQSEDEKQAFTSPYTRDYGSRMRSPARSEGSIERVLLLDSAHTHDHVRAELEAYAPSVSEGSYCLVFDTFVEDLPAHFYPDRPWDKSHNPKTTVHAWLAGHSEFEIDRDMHNKAMITVAPDGFLRRVA